MLNKLFILREELLLEAVDLSTGANIIRAIERGQVPGVKKSVLDDLNRDFAERILNRFVEELKEKINEQDFNRYAIFILAKTDSIKDIVAISIEKHLYSCLIEAIKVYFSHINKKEAKENPEIKKKMEEFKSAPLKKYWEDRGISSKFIDWAKEVFAHKAKAEEGDADVIYDKDGWKIFVPKTFASAKELACMGNRKTNWCTSADIESWRDYFERDKRTIYIIRNEKLNRMYQTDFGKDEEKRPEFNDENNNDMDIRKIKKQIPEEVLKFIKRKRDNKSLFEIFYGEIEETDEPLESISSPSLEEKGNVFFKTLFELRDELKKIGYSLRWVIKGNETDKHSATLRMGTRGVTRGEVRASGKYSDGKNSFIYILPKGEFPYNKYTLKEIKTGEEREYTGSMIFKIGENRLYPFSLKSFLNYPLPKKLDELLNDTKTASWVGGRKLEDTVDGERNTMSSNLKGELDEPEWREKDRTDLLIFESGRVKIYKATAHLKDYLSIPGINNRQLLQIKNNLSEHWSTGLDLLILLTGDSNVYRAYGKKATWIVKDNFPTLVVSNSKGEDKFLTLFDLNISYKERRDFFNFLVEQDYYGLKETFDELRKIDKEITDRLLDFFLRGEGKRPQDFLIENLTSNLALHLGVFEPLDKRWPKISVVPYLKEKNEEKPKNKNSLVYSFFINMTERAKEIFSNNTNLPQKEEVFKKYRLAERIVKFFR